MYKYSILTCVFGGYEHLSEVHNPNPDVEYICCTDDPNLKSNTWQIVVCDSNMMDMSPKTTRWKYPKFHPYEFVSSDICLYIDGSIIILDDVTDVLVQPFIDGGYEYMAMMHPWRSDLYQEVDCWHNSRGVPIENTEYVKQFMANNHYDKLGLFQDCIILSRNTKMANQINNRVFELCHMWSFDNALYRDDQVAFSYIINTLYYHSPKIMICSPQIMDSDYLSWAPRGEKNKIYGTDLLPKVVFGEKTEGFKFPKKYTNMNYNDFKQETLDIFTLVTGPYTAFFYKFLASIKRFFPDNKKRIHIASDGLEMYNGKSFEELHIESIDVKHIIDLPYPLVPIQKTYMQKNYVTDDMKYVFYFDIDTIFLESSDETWEFLFNKIENENCIVLSKHPHHNAFPNLIWNLVEYNTESKAYIPDDIHGEVSDEEREKYDRHVISSFWGGKASNVLRMDDYVNAMFKYDLKAVRYLPKFVDENYIDKVVWQTSVGEVNDIKFYIDEHLISIPGYNFNVPTPHIFLLQKYDTSLKNDKKIVN